MVAMGASIAACMQFRYPVLFAEGPRGTSKTRGILTILLRRAMMYPGARILLCRRYRTDLSRTVLMTLEDEVFPACNVPIPGGPHRSNRSEYRLPNGSTFFPVGIDDGMGILSMGMTFAYTAEAIELTEDQATDILGSMRWTKSPERPRLPEYTQLIMDSNPGAPGHWVNQRAEPMDPALRRVVTKADYDALQAHNYAPTPDPLHRWKRIVTKHQDNPGYWDHARWDYTEQGRRYVNETLETLVGHKRRRWLDGDWVAAEGSVYPEFNEMQHVVTPFAVPLDWPVYVGYDPGYDHPTAVLWVAIAPNGCHYIIDEIHQGGLDIPRLAMMIHQRNVGRNVQRVYGDPQYIYSRTAMSPKPIAQQFAEQKPPIRMLGWPRTGGNEESMVEAVRQRIVHGMLKVFTTCRKTIGEFQSWSYKRTASGELPAGVDKFEDKNNHSMDVIRGLVACNLRADVR